MRLAVTEPSESSPARARHGLYCGGKLAGQSSRSSGCSVRFGSTGGALLSQSRSRNSWLLTNPRATSSSPTTIATVMRVRPFPTESLRWPVSEPPRKHCPRDSRAACPARRTEFSRRSPIGSPAARYARCQTRATRADHPASRVRRGADRIKNGRGARHHLPRPAGQPASSGIDDGDRREPSGRRCG